MKIAVITPGFLPVPAIHGGAIENLIQFIIEGNEASNNHFLDIYTIYDTKLENYKYKNANIIGIKTNILDKILSIVYNRFFIFLALFNPKYKEKYISPYGVNIYFKTIFKKYNYILVENNLSVVNILKNKKNLIFHLHNDILDTDKPRMQCQIALKHCKKIIVVSKYIKKRLELVGNRYSSKISILSNCININDFANVAHHKNKEFVFFYSGRIVQEKGVLELIKAFSKLNKELHNCKLLIVGKSIFNVEEMSNYEREIKEYIKNTSTDNIQFTGFVKYSAMPKYLSNIDCVVIPSKCEESFGLVALEAMAAKKAIIATHSGGMDEIINDTCALFVDKNNLVEELYNQMKKLVQNPKMTIDMGLNGYNSIINEPKYDKENYYESFLKLIEEEGNYEGTNN